MKQGRRASVLLGAIAGAAVALWWIGSRHAPAPSYVNCLPACRASLQGTTDGGAPAELRRIVFDATNPAQPVARTDGLRVALALDGATFVAQPAHRDALSVRIESPEHIIGFRFDPPLDATGITLVSVAVRSSHLHDLAGFGFTPTGGGLHPLLFSLAAGPQVREGFIVVENSPAWVGPIASIAFRFRFAHGPADEEPDVLEITRIAFWHTPDPLTRSRFVQQRLGVARSTAQADAAVGRLKIADETRPIVYAPAPSRCECRVRIPEAAFLDVDFGVLRSSSAATPEGVTFSVSVHPSEGSSTQLFAQHVYPRGDPAGQRWHEERLSLAEFAGQVATLVFETCPGTACSVPGAAGYDYAFWSNLDLFTHVAPNAARPSVLLISLDTVRADRLGCYGYPRDTSPNVDALAARGVLFEQVISQAPETHASHMSLFTGLYPAEHRVQRHNETLPPDVPSLVEAFRAAGYRTAAFTEDGLVSSSYGFDRGFQSYHDGPSPSSRGLKRVAKTFGLAEAWLRRYGDRPFFLFVHTYEAHDPYDPPRKDIIRFAPNYHGSITTPFVSGSLQKKMVRLKEDRLSQADADYISALYDAGIRHLDEEFGSFLATVADLGLERTTLRVILSDHGEEFWDHFALAVHAHTLYDELLHVPLILVGPGVGAMRGKRVPDQVRLIDVLPTVLDLVHVPYDPTRLSGASLVDLLSGRRIAFRETFSESRTLIERVAVRTLLDGRRYKLIHSPGLTGNRKMRDLFDLVDFSGFSGIPQEWELFALDEDPGERRNLAEERPEVLQVLQKRLTRYAADHVAKGDSVRHPIDPEVREQIRALGYVHAP